MQSYLPELMKHIEHIFFDLDHTLWDFDANSKETLKELFVMNELQNEIKHDSIFVKTYKEINAKYWDRYNHGKVSKEELRLGRFRDTFVKLNIVKNEAFIEKMAEDYLRICPTKPNLIEGSIEILDFLKDRYALHIITNGFIDPTERKISSSGIGKYFETITSSEEVGVNKPHPPVFLKSMEKANAKPLESAMIGDNLKADIIGAINTQMTPVLFREGKVRSNPKYYHVQGLLELKSLFEK